MEKFNFEQYGVSELTTDEKQDIDGGIFWDFVGFDPIENFFTITRVVKSIVFGVVGFLHGAH